MIDNICTFLTNKIRKEMPEVDDEKAEIIMYGLQNIIGEIPKTFLVLLISYFLGIFRETLITFFRLELLFISSISFSIFLETILLICIWESIAIVFPSF